MVPDWKSPSMHPHLLSWRRKGARQLSQLSEVPWQVLQLVPQVSQTLGVDNSEDPSGQLQDLEGETPCRIIPFPVKQLSQLLAVTEQALQFDEQASHTPGVFI